MYAPGQVIYDLDKKEPVKLVDNWDAASYPHRSTHFIKPTGRYWQEITEYTVASPRSVEEARTLLAQDRIVPAPRDSEVKEMEYPTILVRSVTYNILKKVQEAIKMDSLGPLP